MAEMLGEFGIATSTGQKVHRGLRAEGLIQTQVGMGSFVTKDAKEKLAKSPHDG